MTKRQDVRTADVDLAIANAQARASKPKQDAEKRPEPKKVTYEMDPRIDTMIKKVAGDLKTSQAGVINRLLLDALQRYARDQVSFDGYLEPSRSPRFDWVVRLKVGNLTETILRKKPAAD